MNRRAYVDLGHPHAQDLKNDEPRLHLIFCHLKSL
jgi:hypothetical protein